MDGRLNLLPRRMTVISGTPERVPLPSGLGELLAQPTGESTGSSSRRRSLILTRGVLLRSLGAFQVRRSRACSPALGRAKSHKMESALMPRSGVKWDGRGDRVFG
jgi:hypothetical protein